MDDLNVFQVQNRITAQRVQLQQLRQDLQVQQNRQAQLQERLQAIVDNMGQYGSQVAAKVAAVQQRYTSMLQQVPQAQQDLGTGANICTALKAGQGAAAQLRQKASQVTQTVLAALPNLQPAGLDRSVSGTTSWIDTMLTEVHERLVMRDGPESGKLIVWPLHSMYQQHPEWQARVVEAFRSTPLSASWRAGVQVPFMGAMDQFFNVKDDIGLELHKRLYARTGVGSVKEWLDEQTSTFQQKLDTLGYMLYAWQDYFAFAAIRMLMWKRVLDLAGTSAGTVEDFVTRCRTEIRDMTDRCKTHLGYTREAFSRLMHPKSAPLILTARNTLVPYMEADKPDQLMVNQDSLTYYRTGSYTPSWQVGAVVGNSTWPMQYSKPRLKVGDGNVLRAIADEVPPLSESGQIVPPELAIGSRGLLPSEIKSKLQ